MAWSGSGVDGGGTQPFPDNVDLVKNSTDGTKRLAVDLAGATTGKTATLDFNHTLDRTYTFPDAAGTVVLTSVVQTITNKIFAGGSTFTVAPTLQDNTRWTFNPGSSVAGINVGAVASNPSSLVNGDIWYRSDDNEYRVRRGGNTGEIVVNEGNEATIQNTAGGVSYRVKGQNSSEGALIANSSIVQMGSISAHDCTLLYNGVERAKINSSGFEVYNRTNSNRGSAGPAGTMIFNTDDGQLNISDGSNWTLPDGTTT